jgi:hypothetical protein
MQSHGSDASPFTRNDPRHDTLPQLKRRQNACGGLGGARRNVPLRAHEGTVRASFPCGPACAGIDRPRTFRRRRLHALKRSAEYGRQVRRQARVDRSRLPERVQLQQPQQLQECLQAWLLCGRSPCKNTRAPLIAPCDGMATSCNKMGSSCITRRPSAPWQLIACDCVMGGTFPVELHIQVNDACSQVNDARHSEARLSRIAKGLWGPARTLSHVRSADGRN